MIRNPYGTEVYGVCVLCALFLTFMGEFTVLAPSYSGAVGLPSRGPCKTAAMIHDFWWSSLYMVWIMITEIVPTGYMFSKRGHMWP